MTQKEKIRRLEDFACMASYCLGHLNTAVNLLMDHLGETHPDFVRRHAKEIAICKGCALRQNQKVREFSEEHPDTKWFDPGDPAVGDMDAWGGIKNAPDLPDL